MKDHLVDYVMKQETPFMVVNLDTVISNYNDLKTALPNVTPYYAIKAFPDPEVVKELHRHGCNFDVATNGEITMLQEIGIDAKRTIHTHPIKSDHSIKTALDYGIDTFVVDNIHEIYKFEKYKDVAKLLIRVSFRGKTAIVDLSKKFGCNVRDVDGLIDQCKLLGIQVVGLSFHVGSQSKNSDDHVLAIKSCIPLLERHDLSVLDIGGGFPVTYIEQSANIFDFCKPISNALKNVPSSVSIFCEPGRFMVGEACDCVASVVGMAERTDKIWYYLDDGVYGMFSGVIYDHVHYPLEVVTGEDIHQYAKCVLAGPTCDSIDVIEDDIMLPILKIGDKIIGSTMGAYTFATAGTFNSLPIPKKIYYTKLSS